MLKKTKKNSRSKKEIEWLKVLLKKLIQTKLKVLDLGHWYEYKNPEQMVTFLMASSFVAFILLYGLLYFQIKTRISTHDFAPGYA